MPRCYVIDVGHGNAAVIAGDTANAIVDAGPGTALIDFLDAKGIHEIRCLLISHADADHIRGAIALMAKIAADPRFVLEEIYVNPDPRDTQTWNDFIHEASKLAGQGRVKIRAAIGSDQSGPFDLGGCDVLVIAPTPASLLHGVGGHVGGGGRVQTANSLSAVVSVNVAGHPVALLPGDLDALGLQSLQKAGINLQCDVVVFPHHGGLPGHGANPGQFVTSLLNATAASVVVFSARSQDPNFPSPAILNGALNHAPAPRVICIGESPALADALPQIAAGHTHVNRCGSVRVDWIPQNGPLQLYRVATPTDELLP